MMIMTAVKRKFGNCLSVQNDKMIVYGGCASNPNRCVFVCVLIARFSLFLGSKLIDCNDYAYRYGLRYAFY